MNGTALAAILSSRLDTTLLACVHPLDFCATGSPFAIVLADEVSRTAETIRRGDDVLALVPLLALTASTHPTDIAPEIDEWLPPDLDADTMAARISVWQPQGEDTAVQLAAFFDGRQIADLRHRFRDQLIEALAAIGTPAAGSVGHRVAGIAGMLGYRRLGALWAAPDVDNQVLRRETRKAIFAISLGELR